VVTRGLTLIQTHIMISTGQGSTRRMKDKGYNPAATKKAIVHVKDFIEKHLEK
jgi:hypothetical protein